MCGRMVAAGWDGNLVCRAHFHGSDTPDHLTVLVAVASILLKGWMYRESVKVARAQKPSILASNTLYHRIDSLSSVVFLVTIMGTWVLPMASAWPDPLGAVVISFIIAHGTWEGSRVFWWGGKGVDT